MLWIQGSEMVAMIEAQHNQHQDSTNLTKMIWQRHILHTIQLLWATVPLSRAFQPSTQHSRWRHSDDNHCQECHVALPHETRGLRHYYLPRQGSTHRTRTFISSTMGDSSMDGGGDLTSALANLDQVWEIQQRSQPRSRWTKLVLKNINEQDDTNNTQENNESESTSTTASTQESRRDKEEFVYLLEPPSFSNPSCLIVFIGGAGLGTFPQVAYQEFLTRISDRMNAAVITAPYNIGLDHFSLAKAVGEQSRKAILQCEDDPERLYSSNLPVYCLAHSLGCKLACIYAAATGQEYDGTGFVSFNNFSFGSTIGMAKEFAQSIRTEMSSGGVGAAGVAGSDTLNGIFDVAQSFLGNIGLEFTPSPIDTERLISLKFDKDRIAKTRLFVMDEDNLDDSPSFLQASENIAPPSLSALPGNHLTPVYFKLDLKDLPEEARQLASESLGGFQSAAFGNDEELDALVEEVCGFLLGKKPSRAPVQLLISGASNRGDGEDQ